MAAVHKIQGPYQFMSEHVQDELNRLLLEECRALEQSRPEPPLVLPSLGRPGSVEAMMIAIDLASSARWVSIAQCT